MDHTILVVDDEPASLRALQRILAPHYEVVAAESGEAGLEVLGRLPISLIVSDHRMPGLSGAEMLARSRASHPDAIRILLTGYADVDALIGAINDGEVFYYLTKPWEARDLLLAVRRGLERLEGERQRRALVRELQDACARAQREAEQKTRLLTMAAHELGTPVHLLGNALDLLAGVAGVRDSEWLDVADRSLAWLRRSLSQMHMGFRLRAGQVRLQCEDVDLGASLDEVLAEIAGALGTRRLALRARVSGAPTVHGDPTWLRQLWLCLLSNAVRFTPDGGAVEVCAGGAEDGAVVRIADTGVGMTSAQIACAFEAFSAAGGDLLRHGSGRFEFGGRGMGLGLSIAKLLVELHGGRIHIESAAGSGTTVEVWMRRGG